MQQWWRARYAGGDTRLRGRSATACSTTGRCSPTPSATSKHTARHGSPPTWQATPACSTSRPSAARSSRCICGLPTSGPISTASDGSTPSSRSTRTDAGPIPIRIVARATAWSSSAPRPGVSAPAARARNRAAGVSGRVERAVHVLRRQAARDPCDAAGGFPTRDRQLLGPGGGVRRACAARGLLPRAAYSGAGAGRSLMNRARKLPIGRVAHADPGRWSRHADR